MIIVISIIIVAIIASSIYIMRNISNNIVRYISTFTLQFKLTNNQKINRVILIKNLKSMNKYIGISLIILVLSLVSLVGIIIFDSRMYFKDLFNSERTKLNLRNEASVDSLLTVINNKSKMIDSLFVVNLNDSILKQTLKEQNNQLVNNNNNINSMLKDQLKKTKSLENKIELLEQNK
jgi:hypothetical protein